ncbi:MAG: leucine-rich repeat protein [Oscillospiraceae bacterium]|nr:leucine-rich repeat protein [Oscillospiraceae bacterium]
MSYPGDFVIKNGVLKKYKGPGGVVVIPEGVTSIGNYAFYGCRSLTSVTIPEGVTSIGDSAFYDSSSLIGVTIPEGVTSIGDRAFSFCISMTEVTIPASVGSIGDGAFFGCRNAVFSGSFLAARKELPTYYLQFFEKTEKTPELLACRMLYQSGKLWKDALTDAAEKADKAAIIRVMLHLLEEEGGEKPAAKIAGTVLDYLEELDIEEMKGAYAVLRKGNYKALRNLVLDEGFQNKWLKLTGKEDRAETGSKNPIEELAEKNWRTTDAVKKLRKFVKEGIRYRDSDSICPPNVLIFLVSEYADQLDEPEKLPIRLYDTYYPQGIHISETADQIAAALDTEQLREKLEFLAYLDKSFRNGFVLALARYGSGRQISHLSSEMRERANWGRHGVAGRQDVMIARGALMLSETREAMIALDKDGSLENYAKMRGTDAETIRDTVLADFGFDQAGKKTYDLGGNRVSVSVDSDLTLRLYDEGAKKTVKSIPRKNADPALLEAAKADVSDLKKNIKRVITHRRDVVFDDFLSGVERDAAKWKKIYLSNPVLRALARLIVWEQAGRRFTVDETGTVDCSDAPFTVADDVPIRVAHPLELPSEEIKAWQDYFMRHALKQPFEQIWEPVYDPAEIGADRYQGAELPIYRFANKDRHGIHSYGLTAYSEDYGFELDDCDLDYEGSTSRIIPGETDDETYTLGAFRLEKLTRRSNHIIFVLDKWTILDRIENNDGSIAALLPAFTLAQLTEFIRLANEKGSSNSLAVLMDYKNRNFAEADPFAEFTLD